MGSFHHLAWLLSHFYLPKGNLADNGNCQKMKINLTNVCGLMDYPVLMCHAMVSPLISDLCNTFRTCKSPRPDGTPSTKMTLTPGRSSLAALPQVSLLMFIPRYQMHLNLIDVKMDCDEYKHISLNLYVIYL